MVLLVLFFDLMYKCRVVHTFKRANTGQPSEGVHVRCARALVSVFRDTCNAYLYRKHIVFFGKSSSLFLQEVVLQRVQNVPHSQRR